MISIFNRTELMVTQSMDQYAKVTAALGAAGIDYRTKALSRSSPSATSFGTREHTGTFAQNMAYDYFYRVYVKKSDYELAVEAVRSAGL